MSPHLYPGSDQLWCRRFPFDGRFDANDHHWKLRKWGNSNVLRSYHKFFPVVKKLNHAVVHASTMDMRAPGKQDPLRNVLLDGASNAMSSKIPKFTFPGFESLYLQIAGTWQDYSIPRKKIFGLKSLRFTANGLLAAIIHFMNGAGMPSCMHHVWVMSRMHIFPCRACPYPLRAGRSVWLGISMRTYRRALRSNRRSSLACFFVCITGHSCHLFLIVLNGLAQHKVTKLGAQLPKKTLGMHIIRSMSPFTLLTLRWVPHSYYLVCNKLLAFPSQHIERYFKWISSPKRSPACLT